MRIGLLQYNPVLGNFQKNLDKVKQLITAKNADSLDLLILPELALTGYAFKSLEHIQPHLDTLNGATLSAATDLCKLARSKMTLVGYPEVTSSGSRFNSAMLVDSTKVLYNYRKKHLYETDESWATAGSNFGLFRTTAFSSSKKGIKMAIGLCMDLNPHQFQAPFDAFEFGKHCVENAADIIIVPMAWLRAETPKDEPLDDFRAIRYWLARLGPVLEQQRKTIFIAANRTGQEESTVYQGNSCIVLIDHGELTILRKMDYEEALLVIDINNISS